MVSSTFASHNVVALFFVVSMVLIVVLTIFSIRNSNRRFEDYIQRIKSGESDCVSEAKRLAGADENKLNRVFSAVNEGRRSKEEF